MEENGQKPSEKLDELRKLTERLLVPPDPDERSVAGLPQLYPGRLPDGLPPELPMPDGGTLVGGSTQNLGRGRWMIEIVLDAEQPAERCREDYRHQLLAAGWQEDQEWLGPGRRGFVPRGLPGIFVRAARRSSRLERRLRGRVPGIPNPFPYLLRFGEDGPRLMVTTAERQNAPTDVRLRILYGRRGDPRDRREPAWETIPSLVPPPGTRGRQDEGHTGLLRPPREARGLHGGGGGRWEPDGAYSTATIQADLDLAAVVEHYASGLEKAGWVLVDRGESGPQAWSTWHFTDEQGRPWNGTFSALRLSGPSTRYLLQVHAGRTDL